MSVSSDDEPISKRRCVPPMSTAQRYDAIARYRKKQESQYPAENSASTSQDKSRPEPEKAGAIFPSASHEAKQYQPQQHQHQSGIAPPAPTTSKGVAQSSQPFYQWDKPSESPVSVQQQQQDRYQRSMEHIQTTRFIDGLRKAVDRHLRGKGELPKTYNLPNYAYNQATKELARLHQKPDYSTEDPQSPILISNSHLEEHAQYHIQEFQKTRIQILQQNGGLTPFLIDTDDEDPT